MTSAELIIAVVFAGLFSAAIVWLAIYYLHRYIHVRCLELQHWLHALISRESEDYGGERVYGGMSSASRSQRSRSKKDSMAGKRRRTERERPRARMRQRVEEREACRAGPPERRPRQERHVQKPEWEAKEQISMESSVSDNMMLQEPAPQATSLVARQMGPSRVLSMLETVPAPVPPQVTFEPSSVHPCAQEFGPEGTLYEELEEPTSLSSGLIPVKTDYIHICNKYPPVVLQALNNEPCSRSSSESDSPSSCSSSTQQIHRPDSPGSPPRPAFQFPQYPHLQKWMWNAGPTSYPRQWIEKFGRGRDSVRYASHMEMSGIGKMGNAGGTRLALSNALP